MDPLIGSIELLSFSSYVPEGWLACNGQLLQISNTTYQALFSLIGFTYGGDGQKTFAVPNLQGKAPLTGMQYCIAYQGVYPSRPE